MTDQDMEENKNDSVDTKDNGIDDDLQKIAFITGGSGFLGRNLIRYLIDKKWKIRAIARSKRSAKIITDLGGESIDGDLDSVDAMTNAMKGCDVCFHCAAPVDFWGNLSKYMKIIKTGTANVIKACKDSKIPKLVHVSTVLVMMSKKHSMSNLNETMSYRDDIFGVYSLCKKEAELLALNANKENKLSVTILRPPLIWGNDDTNLLPIMMKKNKQGIFQWVNNGSYLWNTCHVFNVVHGLYLCYEKGKGGDVYFLCDGKYTVKEFYSDFFLSVGQNVPKFNIPYGCFICCGSLMDILFCCGQKFACCECCEPPFHKYQVYGYAKELSVDDSKIRNELGFKNVISVKEGMLQLCDRFNIDRKTVEHKLLCK